MKFLLSEAHLRQSIDGRCEPRRQGLRAILREGQKRCKLQSELQHSLAFVEGWWETPP